MLDVSYQIQGNPVLLKGTHILHLAESGSVLLNYVKSVLKQSQFCIVALILLESISH